MISQHSFWHPLASVPSLEAERKRLNDPGQGMKVVSIYIRRAAECESLAVEAVSDEERETLLLMARTWKGLADQRRTKLNLNIERTQQS